MLFTRTPFRKNIWLKLMLTWLVLAWVASAISPYSRADWLIENILVISYSALLVLSYKHFQFSTVSYALFTIFLTLHLIGAHYTYSETPIGFWIQELFTSTRNDYDRIVHFSFGLLIAYPFFELLQRVSGTRFYCSLFLAVNGILSFSAFYELLEAVVAVIVSPELGAEWLGTQGDIWDAHKDTGLAFAGSIVAMFITWIQLRNRQ